MAKLVEGLLPQPINAYPRVFFDTLLVDQAAAPQYSQMPAQCRRCQREGGGNFPGAARALLQKVDHRPAIPVGQCGESSVEFRFRHELFTGRIPHALREPPEMTFEIERSIAAIRPVVDAVIVNSGFFQYGGAGSAGVHAMLVHAVNE